MHTGYCRAIRIPYVSSIAVIYYHPMDYRQAEEYLLSFTDYEKLPGIAYTAANYDLRRMQRLLAPFGNPHKGISTVHIAGTKGKGSTAAMVNSALIAAGYRVGLFTSPHLHSLRERVRVNNIPVTEEEFASVITELEPVVERINSESEYGQLTTFEVLTAEVFIHFKRSRADIQVLEAGLGGRLDATNVADGDVCVITSISLDHTEVLGNTVAKIAAEKAGIIKPGSVVVNAPQVPEAGKVIEEVCKQRQCRLVQLGRDITWQGRGGDRRAQIITVKGLLDAYELTIPLIGDFQMENAAAAVAVLELLMEKGLNVPQKAIQDGLREVEWPGRIQVLRASPLVVADGAHNGYSMKLLKAALRHYFGYRRCICIFGTSCDKDISAMADQIITFADEVIVTSSAHPRAAEAGRITTVLDEKGVKAEIVKGVGQALELALGRSAPEDLILVTGSLFVVAEAISYAQTHNWKCG